MLEPESLVNLCEGVDVVFHLAAQIAIENTSSEHVYETNVTGTKNIIKAAKYSRVRKFIHFSSIHAFQIGSPDQMPDESRSLVETNKAMNPVQLQVMVTKFLMADFLNMFPALIF